MVIFRLKLTMVVGWNGWNILFFRVMSEVRTRFKPSAVVCQCGVDTLAGDPMASFNLTQQSIGECVKYLMNWNLPLLLLGGGKLWAVNPNTQQGSSLSVLDKQLSHFACLPGPFLACCHCWFSYTRWLAQTLEVKWGKWASNVTYLPSKKIGSI